MRAHRVQAGRDKVRYEDFMKCKRRRVIISLRTDGQGFATPIHTPNPQHTDTQLVHTWLMNALPTNRRTQPSIEMRGRI